jgi:S1-C subfamily serine protease
MTKVIADLKQFGAVQRAVLGVRGRPLDNDGQTMDAELKKKAEELGASEGFLVGEVVENSSASGILEVDDVIIGIDGKRIKNYAGLQEELAKHRPGDKVKIKILRDKKEKTVEVVLKNEQGTTKVLKDADMEVLGAAFRELPDDLKQQLRLNAGIEVTGVTEGKMKAAGVRKGFIILKANGQVLKSVEQLETIMKEATRSAEPVLFLQGIFPSGKRAYFAVDLTQE